jgi:hypothetical protein
MTLYGSQDPRILVTQIGSEEPGKRAVKLASKAGLKLDPWQQRVLRWALAEEVDGHLSSFEVGLIVPRQNGKGSVLEALELFWLFDTREKLILHSAHEFKTAQEAFIRIKGLVEGTPELDKLVKTYRTSHGEEGIELKDGRRLRFLARSRGSGRGFSASKVVWDEAFNLPEFMVEAMLPTVSAQPEPQIWYTSSSPDKDIAPCEPLGRLRERALNGDCEGLTYLEWSIEPHDDFCPTDCKMHDEPSNPQSWARANPGLGRRITEGYIKREMESMSPVGFARERLGVGNWPTPSSGWEVISEEAWADLEDPEARAEIPVVFAADITPSRSYGAIAVADGTTVEIVDHERGTFWMVDRLTELAEKHGPTVVVIDPSGPAGSLVDPLSARGITVIKPSARQMTNACGVFYERTTDAKTLRHLGQPELAMALSGAKKRPLGAAWAWGRNAESVDISPLVAATLAVWGFQNYAPEPEPPKQYFFDTSVIASPEPEEPSTTPPRDGATLNLKTGQWR